MPDFPKQDSGYVDGLGRMMMNGFRGSTTVTPISVSDQTMNSNSDAFIVDLDSFSNGGLDKDATTNSRISMQRSYSKKGSIQGGQHKESLLVCSSSPRAGGNSNSNSNTQPAVVVIGVGSTHPSVNNEEEEEATVVKMKSRHNSLKRWPPPNSHWFSHPKRVLLFFATLSSLGTLLLIYLTLSTTKSYQYNSNPDWEA